MNNKKMSINKPIVSITEMALIVQLSRARFYQLLEQGFFPKPLHDERSKRPYYDLELQKKILECRQSGIGIDNSFMLFYSPRRNGTTSSPKKRNVDPVVKELAETLQTMGLDVTVKQVQEGLSELFPEGTNGQEQGLTIRELFRYFKNQV